MRYRALLATTTAVVAMAMALAASGASATTVSPAGNITATFPSNGLTFESMGGTTLCPVVFHGSIGTNGIGQITNAIVNSGAPCLGVTFRFTFPWDVSLDYGSPLAIVTVSSIVLEATVIGVRCTYRGAMLFGVANPGPRINPPIGNLSNSCGRASVIGGNGGTLSPQTITP